MYLLFESGRPPSSDERQLWADSLSDLQNVDTDVRKGLATYVKDPTVLGVLSSNIPPPASAT